MLDENYKVPEYPNQERGFILDEQKFAKFSYDLFNFPIFAICCGIYLNIIYIFFCTRKMSIISIIINIFIHYLIIRIILTKLLKPKEIK
jgi:hypothetical protein